MEFMDATDYRRIDCTECNGTGKDIKNRKRDCKICHGSGKSDICVECEKPICICHPNWM
jgi:DnaJ-class molecular chaperone